MEPALADGVGPHCDLVQVPVASEKADLLAKLSERMRLNGKLSDGCPQTPCLGQPEMAMLSLTDAHIV